MKNKPDRTGRAQSKGKKMSDSSCQTIIDKVLELLNTPNTTDTYVVVELMYHLGIHLSDLPDVKWVCDSSHTTKKTEES